MRTEKEIRAKLAHLEEQRQHFERDPDDESNLLIADGINNEAILLKWVLGEVEL